MRHSSQVTDLQAWQILLPVGAALLVAILGAGALIYNGNKQRRNDRDLAFHDQRLAAASSLSETLAAGTLVLEPFRRDRRGGLVDPSETPEAKRLGANHAAWDAVDRARRDLGALHLVFGTTSEVGKAGGEAILKLTDLCMRSNVLFFTLQQHASFPEPMTEDASTAAYAALEGEDQKFSAALNAAFDATAAFRDQALARLAHEQK